jgi:GcrA cell cycle regulator
MDWTDDDIQRLRALWAEGHSTAEIGRRMGVSKNAIVGKAHRLDLQGRPSPIRRSEPGAPTARRSRRPPVPRLADIMPMTATVTVPAAPPPYHPIPTLRRIPTPEQRPAPVPRMSNPPTATTVSNRPCCWPIGEPGTSAFRYCDALALNGKPYCEEHAQLAYRRIRRRDEDGCLAATD